MSANIQYAVVNPITNQTTYNENDVVDFIVNIPQGMQMRKNSLRCNGRLFTKVSVNNGAYINVAPEHALYLNPNTGVHALFNNWNVEFLGGVQETNTEYGRYVSAQTEAGKFYLDTVEDLHSLNELKSMSDSSQANNTNYFVLVGDAAGKYAGSVAYSFKPLICVNKTNNPVPNSKIDKVLIKVQLEPAYKQMKCDNATVTGVSYTMQELNLTYILEPESKIDSLVMERIMVQANNTVVGSMANLQNTTPSPFSKMFMTFKDTTHVNTSNTFTYDYNANETLLGIQRLEFTVNSIDATYSYPLLSNDEILYNYLLCFSPSLDKHSLNLAKLRDPVLSSGFGIGTRFFQLIPQEATVSIDIELQDAPEFPIRVYTYYVSSMSL